MKQYYWVWLYQVKKETAYLKNDKVALKIQTFPNSQIATIIENPLVLENVQIIMVEKVFPYHVKEIKTGLIFPILNIEDIKSYSQYHKITYPFGKVHTFVFSKNNKLIGRKVKSNKELEWYKHEHLHSMQYKEKLQQIIDAGQLNVYEKRQSENEQKLKVQETKIKEKIKNKKLTRQMKKR